MHPSFPLTVTETMSPLPWDAICPALPWLMGRAGWKIGQSNAVILKLKSLVR